MELGRVRAVYGDSLETEGPSCRIGDLLKISSKGRTVCSVVSSFEANTVMSKLLDSAHGIGLGDVVYPTGGPPTIATGNSVLGRFLDPLGRPCDSKGELDDTRLETVALELGATLEVGEKAVREQFVTGIRAIDALVPVAGGQQLLFVAGRGVGAETTFGMLARNSKADVVVAALIGTDRRGAAYYTDDMQEALPKTVTVHAPCHAPPAQQRLCLKTAATLANWFSNQGKSVLLLVNSLSSWLSAGGDADRELSPMLSRLGGRVTGFYRLSQPHEVKPAPELSSLFDGRIVLSSEMAQRMVYPAIDPLLSCATEEFPSEGLDSYRYWARDILARYHKNEDFIKIGAVLPGFNPLLDRSIEYYPELQSFLRQGVKEKSELGTTLERLKGLLPFV